MAAAINWFSLLQERSEGPSLRQRHQRHSPQLPLHRVQGSRAASATKARTPDTFFQIHQALDSKGLYSNMLKESLQHIIKLNWLFLCSD